MIKLTANLSGTNELQYVYREITSVSVFMIACP